MTDETYTMGEYPEKRRHYPSFEDAERNAKSYVTAHINDKFVPRVTIWHGDSEVAQVRASGDGRVWVDMKNSDYPLRA